MKTALFATLDHCSSTDLKPKHNKCPPGEDSRCFLQRAIFKGDKPDSHSKMIKTPLSEHVVARMMPIYQRLASDELFKKCMQNTNEALHQALWTKCPKTIFVSQPTVFIGISLAICECNTGRLKTITDTQSRMGVSPGQFTVKIAKALDHKRLRLAEKRKDVKFQEYRKKKRLAIISEEERVKEKEGLTYGAGEF